MSEALGYFVSLAWIINAHLSFSIREGHLKGQVMLEKFIDISIKLRLWMIKPISSLESHSRPGGGGGGGYSHIWAIRVCAAQQGMFFASLTLEQGIKIALSL